MSDDRKRWVAPHNDPVFAEQTREALIRVLTLKARRALLNCTGG